MEKQKVSQGVKVQLQAVASLRQTQAVLLTRAREMQQQGLASCPSSQLVYRTW